MPKIKLQQIQSLFIDYIINAKNDEFLSYVSNNKHSRVGINKNNIFETLRNTLESIFPKIWLFLGKECANSVAHFFIKKNFPKNGYLQNWGSDFSDFLGKFIFSEVGKIDYLEDIARLEWIINCCYYTKKQTLLDKSTFLHLTEKEILQKKIIISNNVFLYSSKYSINEIWDIDSFIHNSNKKIEIKTKQSFGVVFKIYEDLVVRWIEEDDWFFLKEIKNNHLLIKSYDKTKKKYPKFDPTKIFNFIISNNFLVQE